jgi:hypothetical protein
MTSEPTPDTDNGSIIGMMCRELEGFEASQTVGDALHIKTKRSYKACCGGQRPYSAFCREPFKGPETWNVSKARQSELVMRSEGP